MHGGFYCADGARVDAVSVVMTLGATHRGLGNGGLRRGARRVCVTTMAVKKLLHTRMRVNDLERTVKFYEQALELAMRIRRAREALTHHAAGADLIVAHMGVTTGGSIGAKSSKTLDDCVARIQRISDAARGVNPEVLANKDSWDLLRLGDGDEVVGAVELTTGDEELCFVTSDAQLLHFAASAVRPQGRTGGGMSERVRLDGDAVAGQHDGVVPVPCPETELTLDGIYRDIA